MSSNLSLRALTMEIEIVQLLLFSPRKRGSMFLPALVCLSVTTITKKIVDGFVPSFTGRFLRGKGKTFKFVFRYDRYRDVEVTVTFYLWLTIYHSIKRLEIATISSNGTSLVG